MAVNFADSDITRTNSPEPSNDALPQRPDYSRNASSVTVASKISKLGSRPECLKSTTHEVICVITLCMACAMAQVSVGATQVALPTLGEHFNVTGGVLSWSMSAFSLSAGALLLFMGGIADAFGRKPVVVASFLLYAVFCLASGFCTQYISFVILRALQGITSAAVVPAAAGILGSIYDKPSPRKNRALATFAGGAPIGAVFGALAGGVCLQILNWQSIMYFNAILYAITCLLAVFFVPGGNPVTKERVLTGLRTLDYGGAFLCTAGLTLLTFSLSQAEAAEHGWSTNYIIACIVIGCALIACFIVYECYIPKRPLMPMHIWLAPGFALCMLIGTCGWMSWSVLIYYFNIYFQEIRHFSPLLSSVAFLPCAFCGITVNIIAALILHRVSGKILLLTGMICQFGAALCWCFIETDSIYWGIAFISLILGPIGCDLTYNVVNMQALTLVSSDLQSSAAGVFNTNMQVSTTLALAIGATIVGVLESKNGTSPEGVVKSYRGAYYFAVSVCAIGVILCFFLKIGTQGNQEDEGADEESTIDENQVIKIQSAANDDRVPQGILNTAILSPELMSPIGMASPRHEIQNPLESIGQLMRSHTRTDNDQSNEKLNN